MDPHMSQEDAISILKLGNNVYLTGTAGSGKTYVLQQYISYLKKMNIPHGVTASTGVAATHLNGMTINSWAGIGIKEIIDESEINELLKRKYLHTRFDETRVLIIDEVSLLSARTLESVDKVLKAFKKNDLPFGGIQVVLCGDFFQLPPISKSETNPNAKNNNVHNNSHFEISDFEIVSSFDIRDSNLKDQFVYKSPVWEDLDLAVCYLDHPYRQEDERFLEMLHEIRTNSVTKKTWELLKERFLDPIVYGMTPVRLYTHNALADRVNLEELSKIKMPLKTYQMEDEGPPQLVELMKKNCLAPKTLLLKKGALVMFVKNNFEEGYVNGTLGRVIDFVGSEERPIVKLNSGKEVRVMKSIWEIEDTTASGKDIASIRQYPLRLAWAITIHKSQGMSLDAAEIDLGKSFVTGMGYVALSRVKRLEGLRLRSINPTALRVHEEVIDFDKKLQKMSLENEKELQASHWYKVNKRT